MTREQKLALIVGFSLILLVGVLISDHLSSARKANIAKVEPEPAPMAAAPYPVAPPQTIAERRTDPAPTTPPPVLTSAPTPAPAAGAIDGGTTLALGGEPRSMGTVNPEPSPAETVRVPSGTDVARAGESSLIDEIKRAGGELIRTADGSLGFRLPAAAGTTDLITSISKKPIVEPAPRSTPTPVGPIETVRTHSVATGETLFQIAAKYYGNGNLWRDLVKYNAMDKAGTVRTGMKIKVPSRDTLLGRAVVNTLPASVDPGIKLIKPPAAPPATNIAAPKAAPSKPGKIELASYTVKRGDTLGEISLRTLGTSKRWQEIVDLNHLDDEDTLTPGSVLKIPAKRS